MRQNPHSAPLISCSLAVLPLQLNQMLSHTHWFFFIHAEMFITYYLLFPLKLKWPHWISLCSDTDRVSSLYQHCQRSHEELTELCDVVELSYKGSIKNACFYYICFRTFGFVPIDGSKYGNSGALKKVSEWQIRRVKVSSVSHCPLLKVLDRKVKFRKWRIPWFCVT